MSHGLTLDVFRLFSRPLLGTHSAPLSAVSPAGVSRSGIRAAEIIILATKRLTSTLSILNWFPKTSART